MLTGGKMEHSSRDEIMNEFRTGKTQVLVTTNVLSRGVDVLGVKVVINFEVPMLYRQNQADAQTYLHRCGRTGRYGASGTVINLVDANEDTHLSKIEAFYQMTVTDIPAEDAAEKLEELGKFE